MKGFKHYKLSELSEEWVNNFPKTIDSNGCWIPPNNSDQEGYVPIQVEGNYFRLHRLVVAIYHNLNYSDSLWDARHNKDCDRACFNPEHLQSGTHTDNMRDKIRDGTNHNLNKDKCSKCGCVYTMIKRKSGPRKGMFFRRCTRCANKQSAKSRRKNKQL